jgi:amino acid adenylation domain-containing protein
VLTYFSQGTIIAHRAFSSSARAHGPALLIDSTCRTLQFAAHTFDASLVEILTPLMVGGTVCIPSEHERLNDTAGFINRTGVNHAVLTPSFVSFLAPEAVPGLRRLVLAGEAMAPSHVATWSHIELVNGYGPAESSVAAVVNSHVGPSTAPNDIGMPCGVRVWLVDPADHNRLVPVGCVGEMLLEGPSLSLGYLNDPSKTSESFITDPAWVTDVETTTVKAGPRRFYKTGDLARYNSISGSLSYLGRKDTQVKLHGMRIELGEIEHHLSVDDSVQNAIVFLPKVGPLAKRLIAVLTLRTSTFSPVTQDTAPNELRLVQDSSGNHTSDKSNDQHATSSKQVIDDVRDRLSRRLPAYMVPATWLCVEAIPMLPSRKMDRKSVTTWVESTLTVEQCQKIIIAGGADQSSLAPAKNERASSPLSDTGAKLRRIWSLVLNLREDQISAYDKSFIALGGDSITALACASHAKKAQLDVAVQDILRTKSLHELARKAKPMSQNSDFTGTGDEELLNTPCDLSPIQQLHFQSRGLAQGDQHFNQSFRLRLSRHVKPESIREALVTVVRRHGMLRARFHPTGKDGQWQQIITDDVDASYRFRTHTVATAGDVTDRIASAQECLDVVQGPVYAAELFSVEGQGQQILFMAAHHLVIDLVSWRVILEELEELLEAPSATGSVHRSLSFPKWTSLQREECRSYSENDLARVLQAAKNAPAAQFSYWGMHEHPNLYGNVVCGSFELDAAATSKLSGECNNPLRTETVDILLGALAWSFQNTFRDRSMPAIFNEGHGREALTGPKTSADADISRTVGWFTTLFPVALSTTPASLVDTLVQVKDLRHRAPANGRAQFAAQFDTPEGQALQHQDLEISFNFLGRYQQLERAGALFQPDQGSLMAGEAHAGSATADFGVAAHRFALFEISAVIIHGTLKMAFAWNREMLHQDRIHTWISNCHGALTEAATALPALERRLTVGDFTLLKDIVPADLEAFEKTNLPALTGARGWDAIEDIYPVIPIQQGLLLSRQKDEDTYAVRRAFEVKLHSSGNDSTLSVERIVAAWRGVVQQHALLRTVFVDAISQAMAGGYDQVVLKDAELVTVVRECPRGKDQMRRMVDTLPQMQYADQTLQHRLAIFYSSEVSDSVFCVLEMSHAIMDGTSMDIILRDFSRSYDGSLEQMDRPLFSPFVASLQQRNMDTDLAFWMGHLKGIEPCHFPILNDGVATHRELRTLRIQLPVLPALREFCEATGFTVPNALHTAWALTLGCYTGSDDVCFGYLVSGREADWEDAIGPFINMATQRVKFGSREDNDATLLQVLEAVQRDQLDSMPFSQAPLAEVQHALNIPGGMALFNTCVSYRRLVPSNTGHGSLSLTDLGAIHDPTEYPISLNIEVDEHGDAAVDLDYWTDVVASGQADSVAATFVQALYNISKHANKRLSQLDHVHPETREAIFAWNASIPTTTSDCLHHMVEKQVTARPEHVAIRGWDGAFTYAEMNAAANQLAAHLSELGVKPEVFVPVCFDKSAYTTIAMLAVLKAGGCVTPLNANDPIAALAGKITDTGANVVLASESRASAFEDIVPHVVGFGPRLLAHLGQQPAHDFRAGVTPSDAAFVMFTSGSTGKPKGVVLTHSALASSCLAHGSALGLSPSSAFLQFAAHTFDNSIEEMFTTLLHGGRVCVPSEADRLGNLPGAIDGLDANFMDLTPTVAALLTPAQVPKIRAIAVGGEALTREVLEIWGGKVPLHNQYGPSECSINATHRLHVDASGDVANLGRSVGSVSWIVDPSDHNRLVPVGCVGELLIEGPILARGYLNRPVETAKSFIEAPKWAALDSRHADSGSRRMYKTGDLVRYNCDGSLVYLGRKDTQVKLHGQVGCHNVLKPDDYDC